ncbi:MAG: phage integrase SAM-like domain-containing protein [Saprospiraceae bacterium]|nr:phage integrase SAM-like domain-containing protein [Saprospiraceae bacterium]
MNSLPENIKIIEGEMLFLQKIKSRAYEIIDTYKLREQEFTFEAFRDQLFNIDKPALKDISVFEFFNIKIDELNLAGRTGNAKAFRETKVSLSRFFNLKELKFADIDFNLLIKYETFLRSSNNSDSGVAFRMRELRSLYNDAIKRGYAKRKIIPLLILKYQNIN